MGIATAEGAGRPAWAGRTLDAARGARLALAGALVVGFLLRVWGWNQSLLGDELLTHSVIHGAAFGDLYDRIIFIEYTPPMFTIAAWLTAHLGDDTIWLRLPSLVAGVVVIGLAYALARRVAGVVAGALAAWLVALNPMLVYYSVEARAYMLAVALTLGAVLLLLRALDDGGWLPWTLAGLTAAAAAYTHLTIIVVLVVAWAWALLARRDRWRGLLLSGAGAALLFAAWVPSLRDQGRGIGQLKLKTLAYFSPMGLHDIVEKPARVLTGIPFAETSDVPGPAAYLALAALLLTIGILVTVLRRPAARARMDVPVLALVALCAAAPIAAGLVYGAVTTNSIWLSRNFIASAPFGLVAVAAAMVLVRRPLAVGLAALLVVPYAIADVQQHTTDARPDQRAAARYVLAHAHPGDAILLAPLVNVDGPQQDDVRVYPHGRPAITATPVSTGGVVVPGGQRTLPADHDVIVAGTVPHGTPVAPVITGRPLLAQHSWPGLRPVFVRVYGPLRTRH